MKRTPINERNLPDYTCGEEVMNMVSHIVGGAIGIAVLVFGVLFSAWKRYVWGIVSVSVYGAAMIWLYTMRNFYTVSGPVAAKARGFRFPDLHPVPDASDSLNCKALPERERF